MAGILKVDKYQDFNGNDIMTSDGAGNITVNATGLQNTPAFAVYGNAATTLINSADTKITYDIEDLDTNNNFSSSRFTPTVSGYYQFNANILLSASAGVIGIILYKNGGRYRYGGQTLNNTGYSSANLSVVGYANGSTDYFEIYAIQSSGGNLNNLGGATYNYFQGYKIIGA